MTADEMAALHQAAFTVPRPWGSDEIAGLMASPWCFCLSEPGGFLIGRAVAGEAELLTIAVHPDARRRGVGRRLVAGFLAEARARGAERAFLEVAADNAPALALYRNCGFAETGRRRAYYAGAAGRVDAVIVSRALR